MLLKNSTPSFLFLPLATEFCKERFEQPRTFLFTDAIDQLKAMIETGVIGKVIQGTGSSSLGIKTAKYNRGDACQKDSPHTHQAWLKGNIETCIQQTPVAQLSCSLADGKQLGMGSRVLFCFPQIMGTGNNFVVLDDDTADRYLGNLLGFGASQIAFFIQCS
jgi:hypothetical protein